MMRQGKQTEQNAHETRDHQNETGSGTQTETQTRTFKLGSRTEERQTESKGHGWGDRLTKEHEDETD